MQQNEEQTKEEVAEIDLVRLAHIVLQVLKRLWLIVLLTIAFLSTFFIFPPEVGESAGSQIRNMFEIRGYLFPGDLLGLFALGMWVWDFFAILFGQFKYPVLPELGE